MKNIKRIYLFACLVITYAEEEKFILTSVNCAIEPKESSSIRVSGKEYSQKRDGLNILVYNPNTFQVVISTAFGHSKSKRFSSFFESVQSGMMILVTSQLLCSKKASTDLKIQKSILFGLNRLAFDTQNTFPLNLRSAVFIFCKDKCNITTSISLPFQRIHKFGEDPIVVSFTVSKHETKMLPNNGGHSDNNEAKTKVLYAIIGCCVVFIAVSCVTFALCWYRRRRSEGTNLERQRSCSKDYISHCELTYCSDDYNTRLEQTTSARLFSRLRSKSRKGRSSQKDGSESAFASYIKVEKKNNTQLYKVPSGVSKHKPPTCPPPYNLATERHASNPSLANSYLLPHEYANPETEIGSPKDERTAMSEEGGENFAEYTSLEEYLNDDYVVPQALQWKDEF